MMSLQRRKRSALWPSFFVIAALTSLLLTTHVTAEKSLDDTASLSRLGSFIELATSYLLRVSHTAAQDPDYPGKFTYIAYLDEDLPVNFVNAEKKEYNLLRHNGAIYSLSLLYNRSPDPKILETMQRGVEFLKTHAIAPVPSNSAQNTDDDHVYEKTPHIPNLMAAWETRDLTGGDAKKPTAKLGGAGLALVSLISLERLAPGTTELDYLRQIGEFIRYMQHPDGSFTCRYIPKKGGKDDSWVSLYYPGEAALGLLYLASIEHDTALKKQWIDVATKALLYLERLRRYQPLNEVEPDHWALLTTAQLLPLLDSKTNDYWLVYQHAIKVITSMVAVQSKEELVDNAGCHTADTRTCPTSTRLEGLIASLSFVREEELFVLEGETYVEPLRDRMLYFIELGANFLMESQEVDSSNNMHGGVPVKFPAKKHSAKEVRVDYVQHSVSALLEYEKLLKKKKKGGLVARSKNLVRRSKVMVAAHQPATSGQYWSILLAFAALAGVAAAALKLRKPKKVRVL